jgi:hypothetical protein
MNKQRNLRNITTKEDLIAFLQAVYHEDKPNLHKCTWQPRDEDSVYLWYKDDVKAVSGKVVEILRSLPPKPTFLQRIAAFFR